MRELKNDQERSVILQGTSSATQMYQREGGLKKSGNHQDVKLGTDRSKQKNGPNSQSIETKQLSGNRVEEKATYENNENGEGQKIFTPDYNSNPKTQDLVPVVKQPSVNQVMNN